MIDREDLEVLFLENGGALAGDWCIVHMVTGEILHEGFDTQEEAEKWVRMNYYSRC